MVTLLDETPFMFTLIIKRVDPKTNLYMAIDVFADKIGGIVDYGYFKK